MNLTTNQQRAVTAPLCNLQLIACAGSGKTEVVAQRVVHLLRPKPAGGAGLKPANIIAFTFTERAAGELKDRIIIRCREQLGCVNGLAEMYVGTIHGFCLDFLKTDVPKYLKYDVLNEVQLRLFVDRHSRMSGLTECTDLRGQKLKRFRDTSLYISAMSILREDPQSDQTLRNCAVADGLDAYIGLLDDRGYLDYSGILDAAVDALTNDDDARRRLSERVKCVIVDEYQDVNPVQEAVVWQLHELGAKVCVVGDDDQTIYQWRGSDVENILTFANRYPKVKTINLEENFRSSEGVVETAHAFIVQNSARLEKEMTATRAQSNESGDLVALGFDDPEQEAQYIAETAQDLRGVAIREDGGERGISWSDMAVLLRSVANNGGPILRALESVKVPYIVVGMNSLFDTAEAQAARQLFYFMAGRATSAEVEKAWREARTGATRKQLQAAIDGASASRAAMQRTEELRFSYYSIQRQFLGFIECLGVREESVPDDRGEVLLYNLGKFSQLISDFETIHYKSDPVQKYAAFADFLLYGAEGAYPEGWQDNTYANPDAVRVMTVHQAKGMQWPVVFVPALLKNRFPSKKMGGRNIWHLLPRAAFPKSQRYDGTTEDERRLFYVAMTRTQKFLHMTWAPVPGKRLYQGASEFYDDVLASRSVKRRRQDYSNRKRLEPKARAGVANVTLSFSDVKYFFECPYQFKLRVLYGFNAPIHEALGYGKSLHDALAELHTKAIEGYVPTERDAKKLVATHLRTPYAYPSLQESLQRSAEARIAAYIVKNRDLFSKLEYSEKQVEISLGDGITVTGRIDLVRRTDTNEISIVDLKSTHHAQAEDVTEMQLHTYALGYQELTGRNADYVETYNLDKGERKQRSVDDDFVNDVKVRVTAAAKALRAGKLQPEPLAKRCAACDYGRMCSAGAPFCKKKADNR